MTRYEHGFITKCAQKGMSDSDIKMLVDYVTSQKAEAARRDKQNKQMRSMNRAKRVRGAKARLMLLLGGAGAAVGALAGKAYNDNPVLPGVIGGIGGAIGGWHLGDSVGNREADKQEELEDRTGQSIALQNVGRDARRAGNLAAWSLLAPRLTTSGSLIL